MRPPIEVPEERSGQTFEIHVNDRELARYARGLLSEEAAASVKLHLGSCRFCAEVLADLKADAEAAQAGKEHAVASGLEAFRVLRSKALKKESTLNSTTGSSKSKVQHGRRGDVIQAIRDVARKALAELYQRRYEIWSNPPSSLLDVIEPSAVAKLWGIRIEELTALGAAGNHACPPIAGLIDIRLRVIQVSSKLRPEIRRFTMAHELGHYILHTHQGVLFRDSPISGAERLDRNRPLAEREADLFAAELLMPAKLVRQTFLSYFGKERLCHAEVNEDVSMNLLLHAGGKVTLNELKAHGSRTLALCLAGSCPWTGREGPPLIPLCRLFRVSKVAMAIQLESLGLVA